MRITELLHEAQGRGLLPAEAATSETDHRPWPIVLLTALGAWLAAIPLILVVGLITGPFMMQGPGAYAIGALALAAAVTVLRSRDVPVFIEQLAVPALLVGGGVLAYAFARDVSPRATAGVICVIALGVAMVVARAWLRLLLGACAATLAGVLLTGNGWLFRPGGGEIWQALHLVLLAGVGALAFMRRPLDALRADLAVRLEPIAVGWLTATLVLLCWWSGMTFLAGGMLSPGGGWMWGMWRRSAGELPASTVSLLLAIAGILLLARAWPTLRHPLAAGAAVLFAALAFFLPALGASLLILALAAVTHRWRLALLAILAAAWIVGSFYYALDLPLAHKALVLASVGAGAGLLAWIAHRGGLSSAAAGFERRPAAWIAGGAVAVLAALNISIWQKEDLIARGDKVFVALAPVDPRSLMQGDFMRLNYRLPEVTQGRLAARPRVVVRRDKSGVAEVVRLDTADLPLQPGELRIELTPRNGGWVIASDAWFFGEGDAQRWTRARYAEFRVTPDARALLVDLADDKLNSLSRAR